MDCVEQVRKIFDDLVKSRFIEMFGKVLDNPVKLSDLSNRITKGTTPTTAGFEFTENGVNFVKIENITENGQLLKDSLMHVSQECHDAFRRSQLQKGDILFSIAGAIGRTAVITEDVLPANTNQALAIIRLKDNIINTDYLIQCLHSEYVLKQYRTKKRGAAQLNLSLEDISNLKIPLPERSMQDKFASFIQQVDKSKFIFEQEISRYDQLVKSRFIEMFKGHDYPMKTIGELCSMKSGTTLAREQELTEGTLRYCKVSDMNLPGNEKIIQQSNSFAEDSCRKTSIPANSIIFPKRGGAIGTNKKRIVLEDTCVDLNIMGITPSSSLNLEYLYQFFQNLDMGSLCNGSSVPQINNKDIAPLQIIVPPIELQNEFESFIKQVDKSKFALLETARKLAQSMV